MRFYRYFSKPAPILIAALLLLTAGLIYYFIDKTPQQPAYLLNDDFAHLKVTTSPLTDTIHSLTREKYVYATDPIELPATGEDFLWQFSRAETNDRELLRQLTQGQWSTLREQQKAGLWHPDFTNIPNYLSSVEENRQHLRDYLGILHPDRRGSVTEEMNLDLPPNDYTNDVRLSHLIILSRVPHLYFDAYIVEPPLALQNGWGVVAVHGHSSSAEKMIGFGEEDYTRRMALRLARRGFWVIVPNVSSNQDLNNIASAHAALYGYTLNGIMVEFIQSALDIAQERGYQKIGLMGISNGGLLSLLTAGVDDRPDFVVASGILTSFYQQVLLPQTDRILKNYYFYYDGPFWLEFDVTELAFLVVPRPLIFTIGLEDENVLGWEPEYKRVKTVYEALKIPQRLGLIKFYGRHELDEDYTIELLSAWIEQNK